MGLTNRSVGAKVMNSELVIRKESPQDIVVALAGNPNVGKSTVFNSLTGMNQHTGNWPGKTVVNAQGICRREKQSYVLVDIPGTYSLLAHSAEEEVARNFICFGEHDVVVVVCDATCLERNLNLVLQTLEITDNVVVCVNLLDEAKRKNIHLDLPRLSERLGVPVVGTVARKKKTLDHLLEKIQQTAVKNKERVKIQVHYPDCIEEAIDMLEPVVHKKLNIEINTRWLSLRLLDDDPSLLQELRLYLGDDFLEDEELTSVLQSAKSKLNEEGITNERMKDLIVSSLVRTAEKACEDVVVTNRDLYHSKDQRIDRILTGKLVGYPLMLLLLAGVFWLTITGANYPSGLIANVLFWLQDRLSELLMFAHFPVWLHDIIVYGIYRVLAWVVSVMLPPMAIFFPLFTLLEDAGYLPRVAYNLDKPFKCCHACGKQALTMCMGFGCNAAGVIGCRIIDSPRERLMAILTNNFVPCNGRFPTLIAILTMFFVGVNGGGASSILSALLLTLVIVFGVAMTFGVTKLLSVTLLKGVTSSYTLELPPYRRPQIGKVIVRSIFDRTLFVLGRAVIVAIPAGMIIWLMANITIADNSLLNHVSLFLDPFAKLLGLDGVILIAFILGFPANEIVVPIIIMAYLQQGSILEMDSLAQMKQLFVDNGWTWVTAVCTMLFSLVHWPCSTTMLTIKKETGSFKWSALAFAIPTVLGIMICFVFANVARLFL